jgi:hypothetical protein
VAELEIALRLARKGKEEEEMEDGGQKEGNKAERQDMKGSIASTDETLAVESHTATEVSSVDAAASETTVATEMPAVEESAAVDTAAVELPAADDGPEETAAAVAATAYTSANGQSSGTAFVTACGIAETETEDGETETEEQEEQHAHAQAQAPAEAPTTTAEAATMENAQFSVTSYQDQGA